MSSKQREAIREKAGKAVDRLCKMKDFSKTEPTEDLSYIATNAEIDSEADKEKQRRIYENYFEHIARHGMVEVFEKIWKQLFQMEIFDERSKTLWKNLNFTLSIIWCGTDVKSLLVDRFLQNGTYKLFIKALKDPKLLTENSKNFRWRTILNGIFCTIQNILDNAGGRQEMRDMNIIEALKPYLKVKSVLVRMLALETLMRLMDENENEMICGNEETIKFLLGNLKNCMSSLDHKIAIEGVEFHSTDMMLTLNLLAVNETNKVGL